MKTMLLSFLLKQYTIHKRLSLINQLICVFVDGNIIDDKDTKNLQIISKNDNKKGNYLFQKRKILYSNKMKYS